MCICVSDNLYKFIAIAVYNLHAYN
jgi:hypothetical protein